MAEIRGVHSNIPLLQVSPEVELCLLESSKTRCYSVSVSSEQRCFGKDEILIVRRTERTMSTAMYGVNVIGW